MYFILYYSILYYIILYYILYYSIFYIIYILYSILYNYKINHTTRINHLYLNLDSLNFYLFIKKIFEIISKNIIKRK